MKEKRLCWENYFIDILNKVKTRSTCLRRKIGAIAVKENRILATGYNGAPPGIDHCIDKGCIRDELNIPSGTSQEKCRAVHGEQNLIVQAALHGIKLKGSDIYCNTQPCIICAKMLLGIMPSRIIYLNPYPDKDTISLFEKLGMSYSMELSDKEYITIWDFSIKG